MKSPMEKLTCILNCIAMLSSILDTGNVGVASVAQNVLVWVCYGSVLRWGGGVQELGSYALSDCVYCNGDALPGSTYKLSKPLFDAITPSIIHLTQVLFYNSYVG